VRRKIREIRIRTNKKIQERGRIRVKRRISGEWS